MPIGDPMGGATPESDRGSHLRIDAVMVPVSDMEQALEFYTEVLNFEVVLDLKAMGRVELAAPEGGARITLFIPEEGEEEPGIRTGIIIATDSIFDFHKVLVDEGVEFILKPERDRFGRLIARFLDFDGNEIEVVDVPSMARQ